MCLGQTSTGVVVALWWFCCYFGTNKWIAHVSIATETDALPQCTKLNDAFGFAYYRQQYPAQCHMSMCLRVVLWMKWRHSVSLGKWKRTHATINGKSPDAYKHTHTLAHRHPNEEPMKMKNCRTRTQWQQQCVAGAGAVAKWLLLLLWFSLLESVQELRSRYGNVLIVLEATNTLCDHTGRKSIRFTM